MLTRLREDSMIQCACDPPYERRRTEDEKKIIAKAKTEDILIATPVDPLPDLCMQAKAEQEELNGKLDTNVFQNLNHIKCILR